MASEIVTAREKNVGFITFNRPHLHNAISLEMWHAIPEMIEKLRGEGVQVIVFTGEGDSFASGADLDELRKISNTQDADRLWSAISNCLETVWSCEIPTIAMVHGACIGGGCLLATSCDFRLASFVSSFAIPVAKLGLVLDDRTVGRIVAAGGSVFARTLLYAGATIGARRAHELGYLYSAVELNKLRFEVMELAQAIAGNVQDSVLASKRAINNAANLSALGTTVAHDRIVASYLTDEFKRRVKSSS
ncbi:MAG TPA: enoyl-CoA hydratase/isomerase family protein [Planktothrix sp.]